MMFLMHFLRNFSRCKIPYSLCIVLSFSPAVVFAATDSKYQPISADELGKALANYKNISKMDVHFRQTKTLKAMDLTIHAEGDLRLRMPDEVIYSVNKPARLEVTLTPGQIKYQSGSGASVTSQIIKTGAMTGDSDKRNLEAMMTWLKMDPVMIAKTYEVSTDHQRHFRFLPREVNGSPFHDLDVELGNSGNVKTLTMHEASGDQIDFDFDPPKIVRAAGTK